MLMIEGVEYRTQASCWGQSCNTLFNEVYTVWMPEYGVKIVHQSSDVER